MTRLYLLTTLVLLFLSACREPTPPEDPEIAPRVDERTQVVSEETRQALSDFTFTNEALCNTVPDPINTPDTEPARCTARLVFSRSTPYLASLKVGALMVSEPGPGAPYGYLQKITSISSSGQQVIVETEAASLDEALLEGQLEYSGKLTPADLSAQSLREGIVPRAYSSGQHVAQGQNFAFDIDTVLLDADNNPSTANDQVRLKGSFQLGTDDGLSFALRWKKAFGIPIYPNGIHLRLAYGFNQNSSISLESDLDTPLNMQVELATFTFDPITLFVGPVPVVIVPVLRITSDLQGNLTANMSLGASESVTALAGFEYRDGFKDISQFSQFFSPHSATSGVSGRGEVGVNVQGEMRVYGLVGPYARIQSTLVLDAKIPRDPVWKLSAGLKGYSGIHANLLVANLNYDKEIFTVPLFEIGRSANHAPTVVFKTPSDGQEYSQNVLVDSICVTLHDPETPLLNLTLSSNIDGVIEATTVSSNHGSHCAPSRKFSTVGVRTITATVTDKGGLSATASRTIHIINNPPSVLISKPYNHQQVYIDNLTQLKGSMVDPNETPGCERFKWKSSVPADVLPANNCGSVTGKFKTLGMRTLTLEVTDSENAVGKDSVNVEVVNKPGNIPPDVLITVPEAVPGSKPRLPWPPGESMTVKARILDPDSSAITYTWKLAYLRKGAGPYIADVQTQTVNPFNQEYSPELTFRPHEYLGISGSGEFKCYNVDPDGLELLLTAQDGSNPPVTFRLPLEKGCSW